MQLNFSNKRKLSLLLVLCGLWSGVPAVCLAADGAAVVPAPAKAAAAAQAAKAAPAAGVASGDNPDIVLGGGFLPVEGKEEGEAPAEKPVLRAKSLFFTAQEMAAIRKAVAVYTRVLSGEGEVPEFLKRQQGGGDAPQQAMRYFVYPQFFLASLVFQDAKDWSVRLNNQTLSFKRQDHLNGIRILSIDKDKAVIEWTPDDFRKVEEVWHLAPNKQIKVDMGRGTVTFALRPNQTFSSYVMRVLEGKVQPMALDLSPKARAEKAAAQPSLDKKKTVSPAAAAEQPNFLDVLMGKGRE